MCDEQGQWGECAGEVVPRVEDCRTAIDEDCDGRRACSGEVEWVRAFAQPAGGEYGHVSATGLAIDVHAYLLYELVTDGNALRIGRLAAHWDLPRMSLHVMTRGLRGLWTMTMTTVHMLRHQGVGGVLGYMRGMTHGMFGRGTRAVARLADAISQRDVGRLAALLSPDACVDLIVPAHAAPAAATSPPALTAPAARLLASLPAGAQFTVDSALSSGFTVAFRYACPSDGGPRAQPAPHGIGFCTFSSQATRGQRAITVLRLFPTPSAP